MIFIYLLEANPQFLPKVELIQRQIEARGDSLVTSVFTLGEVLTGPRRTGNADIVATVKAYFESGRIQLLTFDAQTADRYSILRSTFRISQADAIHLASAAVAGVDAFITNDRDLLALQIPEIKFIVGLDGKIF